MDWLCESTGGMIVLIIGAIFALIGVLTVLGWLRGNIVRKDGMCGDCNPCDSCGVGMSRPGCGLNMYPAPKNMQQSASDCCS